MMNNTAAVPIPVPRIRSTCDACLDAKVRCSRDRPTCRRCQQHGRECVYSMKRRLGRPKGTSTKNNASKPCSGTDSASTTPQQELPGPFPGGLPSPSGDHETGDMSMDMLLFDQNMSFAGNNNNNNNYGSFFPPWSSGMDTDSSELFKNNAWRLPTPSSVPDMQNRQFSGSWSDATTTLSPTAIDSIPTTNDTRQFFSDYAGSLGTPSTMVQSPMQRKDPRDGSDFMFPASLPNIFTGNFGHTHDSRPSTTASAMNSSSAIRSGQLPDSFTHRHMPSAHVIAAKCTCYSNILQRLSELQEEKATFLSTRVDNIMKLEKDVRLQTQSMLRCDLCSQERPRSLLLVGVLLESIIDLLEGVPVRDPRRPIDTRLPPCLPRRQSMPAHMHAHSNADTGRLVLGEYEISGDEKLDFLRHLVHSRLKELAVLAQQLHDHTQSCGAMNPNFRAAAAVMAGCSQRIHATMSRLQG